MHKVDSSANPPAHRLRRFTVRPFIQPPRLPRTLLSPLPATTPEAPANLHPQFCFSLQLNFEACSRVASCPLAHITRAASSQARAATAHDAASELRQLAATSPSRTTACLDCAPASITAAASWLSTAVADLWKPLPAGPAGPPRRRPTTAGQHVWPVRKLHERSHDPDRRPDGPERVQARPGVPREQCTSAQLRARSRAETKLTWGV